MCLPPRCQGPAFTHAFVHPRCDPFARMCTCSAHARSCPAVAVATASILLWLGQGGQGHKVQRAQAQQCNDKGGEAGGLPHLGVTCGQSRRALRRGQRAPRTPPRAAPAMSVSWPISTSRKVTKKKIFLLKHNFRERIERRIDPRQDSEGGRERPACHAAGGFSRCFPCRIVLPVG